MRWIARWVNALRCLLADVSGRIGYAPGAVEDAQSVVGTANTALNVDFAAPGAGYRWRLVLAQVYATGGAFANQVITVESPVATVKWRYAMGTQAATTQKHLVEPGGVIFGGENAVLRIAVPALGVGIAAVVNAMVIRELLQIPGT